MRLVAGGAIQGDCDFVRIRRIHLVNYRVMLHRMSKPVLDRQDWNFGEVIFRQSHFPVEDRDQMLAFEFLRLGIRPVALQAKRIRIRRSQQVQIVIPVRVMADGA